MLFDPREVTEDELTKLVASHQKHYPYFKWSADQPKRMDPQEKKELIAALRSGEYEQARGVLKKSIAETGLLTDVGHCCLGVETDLQVRKGLGKWVGPDKFTYAVLDEDGFVKETTGVLAESICNKIGMTETGLFARWEEYNNTSLGYMPSGQEHYELTVMNDQGFTFDQIADIINYFL